MDKIFQGKFSIKGGGVEGVYALKVYSNNLIMF